jgi:hypothetical protein
MRAFQLRSGNGEEETGGACVVEGRCENFEGSGEGEGLGASGGEEAASDARRCGSKGDGARCEVPVNQSKATVIRGENVGKQNSVISKAIGGSLRRRS